MNAGIKIQRARKSTPQERIDLAKTAAYMGLNYLEEALKMLTQIKDENYEYAWVVEEAADRFADECEIIRDAFLELEKQASE